MNIPFIKMHGLGNDFIVINCLSQAYPALEKSETIKKICDRRFGIGADQLLLLYPSETSDYQMKIFNADGGEVEMCGNGIRCLAKYLNELFPEKSLFEIETLAGIIKPEVKRDMVVVDMGPPELEGDKIPVNIKGRIINHAIEAENFKTKITCISMGNPHCVTFCNDKNDISIETHGPLIEKHPLFPNRTNVEFVEIIDTKHIRMRVWERGSGITLACGTGACAAAVASILNKFTDRDVEVKLDGGSLFIHWDEHNNHVYMTGPAQTVFTGKIDLKKYL